MLLVLTALAFAADDRQTQRRAAAIREEIQIHQATICDLLREIQTPDRPSFRQRFPDIDTREPIRDPEPYCKEYLLAMIAKYQRRLGGLGVELGKVEQGH